MAPFALSLFSVLALWLCVAAKEPTCQDGAMCVEGFDISAMGAGGQPPSREAIVAMCGQLDTLIGCMTKVLADCKSNPNYPPDAIKNIEQGMEQYSGMSQAQCAMVTGGDNKGDNDQNMSGNDNVETNDGGSNAENTGDNNGENGASMLTASSFITTVFAVLFTTLLSL